jgi:NTE family protein
MPLLETRDFTLVCGGGGIWGVAWMTGLVAGLEESGINLRAANRFIGTSAGSVISAQLTSTLSTKYLFQRQTDPANQPREFSPSENGLKKMTELLRQSWRSDEERLHAVSKMALESKTISVEERRTHIIDRLGLPSLDWPKKDLRITAVDSESLGLCVFDPRSGILLLDAVAASCAVPGVWPPTPINGRRYLDGGVWRTAENAHLAAGSKIVVILSPMGRLAASPLASGVGLEADIATLKSRGAKVLLITADESCLRTMAPGLLDPATRKPAAEAGQTQGLNEAAAIRAFFSSP